MLIHIFFSKLIVKRINLCKTSMYSIYLYVFVNSSCFISVKFEGNVNCNGTD